MPVLNIGRVRITPKGQWDDQTAYTFLDLVTDGGSSYLARQDAPAGTVLTSTSYWLLIASKGDTGEQGTQGEQGPAGNDGIGWVDTFESIAKNITGDNATPTFVDGRLESIEYDLGGGKARTKTLGYDANGRLVTVTLSGDDLPVGMPTTKTINYDANGAWAGNSYS